MICGVLLAACGLAAPFTGRFASNGERIFYTGVNDEGQRIPYSGGPESGMMMQTRLACADCHGSDGRGGTQFIHMQSIEAPDIRYSALNAHTEADEHENNGDDDHSEEYTLETFRMAVVEGMHPDGDPLSMEMPRWNLTDEDLQDLFDFLKTLP